VAFAQPEARGHFTKLDLAGGNQWPPSVARELQANLADPDHTITAAAVESDLANRQRPFRLRHLVTYGEAGQYFTPEPVCS
jgi:hypothetical protein